MSKDLENRIRQTLDQHPGHFQDDRTKEALVHELSVYHQELEFQNQELQRIAQDLDQSRRNFETLFETAPVAYVAYDEDYTVKLCNQRFAGMVGLPAATVLGTDLRTWLSPASQDAFYLHCREVRQGKASPAQLQVMGREQTFEVRVESNVWLEQGLLTRSALIDITGEVQAREALFQAQKLESIGLLAGGVAHEFNNMLTIIFGALDLARLHSNQPDKLNKDFENIYRAAKQSADTVAQLLAFARKQVNHPQNLALNPALDKMLPFLRHLIEESVAMEFWPHPDAGQALIDPVQFKQVLTNLLINARDALPGRGLISIATQPARHGWVSFSVTDNGRGIPAALKGKIFEPFFSTKPAGQGSGLGLSTVEGIVRQNGGQVLVDSTEGQGATFTIVLPEARGATTSQPVAKPVHTTKTLKVAVVEDLADIREVFTECLETLGHQVTAFANPLDLLDRFRLDQQDFDLLITDLIMPEMDGRELARQISELKPGLKILFMSGYTGQVLAAHGMAPDQKNFLSKPFSLQALVDKIAGLMAP